MVPLAFERISPEKQLAVINAGFSCFGETGFLKTSMRDVAQAAGISKASFFIISAPRKRFTAGK